MIMPTLFAILFFAGCQNTSNTHEEEPNMAISSLSTPYVGNVSAVSSIIQLLPIPQDSWQQRFMSIGNDSTPYALTVYYEPADPNATAMQTQEMPIDAFERNATFLFEHICNLEKVTFSIRQTPSNDTLDISAYEYHWTITRSHAP